MRIIAKKDSACREYTALELLKYIRKISNCTLSPALEWVEELPREIPDDAIVLGLLSELGLDQSDLHDAFIEDILDVRVENARGYLAGSNERSILMAVYHYCKSAGCRFIRPGEDGEYIPHCDLTAHTCTYRKKADQPFRGTCCEGAISYEHMRDTVYWMPKMGMNMFMIEGLVPFSYMHRWYGHEANRILREPGQVSDYEELAGYIQRLQKDINQVGVQLHTAGHAWMFEDFGIHHVDPATEKAQIAKLSAEQKQLLAEVGGVRDLFQSSTFFTHFCYSNPAARRFLVNFCVNYIKSNPSVDFLHLWLADNVNNQCECESCLKMTPSDWYVMLLNEIDEALEGIESKTRLVFIAYSDTVRPPVTQRLRHPERFMLLVAIGGFYERGYRNEPCEGACPPYRHNEYAPLPVPWRIQCYKDWKALCGDIPAVVYEYRYYTDHYCDPGYMRIARETVRDMRFLKELSLSGCMSDQTHRNFLPTSLPMSLMGATLFDESLDAEAFTADFFYAAFGEKGALVREYLETLSDLFCPSARRAANRNSEADVALGNDECYQSFLSNAWAEKKLAQIPDVLQRFAPVIREGMALGDPCHRQSFVYLYHHAEICKELAHVMHLGSQGRIEEAKQALDALEILLSQKEPQIHRVFDNYLFIKSIRSCFKIKMVKSYQ